MKFQQDHESFGNNYIVIWNDASGISGDLSFEDQIGEGYVVITPGIFVAETPRYIHLVQDFSLENEWARNHEMIPKGMILLMFEVDLSELYEILEDLREKN